jgi:hypothetical protein
VEREKNPGDSEFKPQYGQKKKEKKRNGKMVIRYGIRNPKLCDTRNYLEMLELPLGNSDCF